MPKLNNPSDIVLFRYSPDLISENNLRKLFVRRGEVLESLLKELDDRALKKTPRFFLIVGSRGIGKSHLLSLLYYELKRKSNAMIIPIKMAEEEYSVISASDLFLRVLEEIPEDTSSIRLLKEKDEILYASVERLKEISKKDSKMYTLIIENLNNLFGQFDEGEQKKLRSIFQENDIFSIVSSAPMIFPEISDHDKPFYDFFRVIHLREFSLNEIESHLKNIAELEDNKEFLKEFENNRPLIQIFFNIVGGNPRLVLHFYETVIRNGPKDVVGIFFKILDDHTPYFQKIFQLMTPQKRRIFDTLCFSEGPITPKQVSEVSRIPLPTVTTQLRRLEKEGFVISRPEGRHTKYEVRGRLFRLWRKMRHPLGRKKVSLFLEFLKHWYTPIENKFETKIEILTSVDKTILKNLSNQAGNLPQKLKEKIPFFDAVLLLSEDKYEDAIKILSEVLKINPENEFALSLKGLALENLGKQEEALETFKIAKELAKNDYSRISNSLNILKIYRVLEKKTEAILVIEEIKDLLKGKDSSLIELFVGSCFDIALLELKDNNIGNGAKIIKLAYDTFLDDLKLIDDKIAAITVTFLKNAADLGISVIKTAAEEISKVRKNEYTELIRPIIKAIEIVEDRKIKKYYDLHGEEREIVAEIVKMIDKTDELIPAEIKNMAERKIVS